MRFWVFTAAAALLGTAGAAPAQADYYPPFYGYSPYFGGPAPYFEGDDVHSSAIISEGLPGMGTRTYYRGGPFFHYRTVRAVRPLPARKSRRVRALTTKG
jgi:hypothetical protein